MQLLNTLKRLSQATPMLLDTATPDQRQHHLSQQIATLKASIARTQPPCPDPDEPPTADQRHLEILLKLQKGMALILAKSEGTAFVQERTQDARLMSEVLAAPHNPKAQASTDAAARKGLKDPMPPHPLLPLLKAITAVDTATRSLRATGQGHGIDGTARPLPSYIVEEANLPALVLDLMTGMAMATRHIIAMLQPLQNSGEQWAAEFVQSLTTGPSSGRLASIYQYLIDPANDQTEAHRLARGARGVMGLAISEARSPLTLLEHLLTLPDTRNRIENHTAMQEINLRAHQIMAVGRLH